QAEIDSAADTIAAEIAVCGRARAEAGDPAHGCVAVEGGAGDGQERVAPFVVDGAADAFVHCEPGNRVAKVGPERTVTQEGAIIDRELGTPAESWNSFDLDSPAQPEADASIAARSCV